MPDLNLSLDDLLIAYRKAKADAYYENGHNMALHFAEYELDLFKNLNSLLHKISPSRSPRPNRIKWYNNGGFVGSFAFILKAANTNKVNSGNNDGFVFYSNTDRHWKNMESMDVDYRIIGQHSVDFHIISSLWIDRIGLKLEEIVSENSYGCRLKRPGQSNEEFIPNKESSQNTSSDKFQLGHFRPYYNDYKRWQTNGISSIRDAIKDGKKVVAITTDLKKFYHRINPEFLLNPFFLSEFGLDEYLPDELHLTEIMVSAIKAWSDLIIDDSLVPEEFKVNGHCGVPLGLGASKVIANVLLAFLDREIETELTPIYYGRYVDDIFLIIEDNGKINSKDDFWKLLSKRIDYIVPKIWLGDDDLLDGPEFKIPYAENSVIQFGGGKEKLFLLEGTSGESFIETLQDSLDENSSEWKMLPDCEEDLSALTREMAKASADLEEPVNGLRKADGISIQRLKFALHLRNFEAIVGLIPKSIWKKALFKFFSLSENFIISPDRIGTYSKYYPRLIRLAVMADEPLVAIDIWDRINASWKELELKNKEGRRILKKAQLFSQELLKEAIYSSIKIFDTYTSDNWRDLFDRVGISAEKLRESSEKLFFSDLHAIPFRKLFFEDSLWHAAKDSFDKYAISPFDEASELSDTIINVSARIEFLHSILTQIGGDITQLNFLPKALFFYTRPFNTLEITQLYPNWANDEFKLKTIRKFLSLFNIPLFDVQVSSNYPPQQVIGVNRDIVHIDIMNSSSGGNRVFALTSFQTEDSSWVAWVRDDGTEPDSNRYIRLFKLINDVLKCKKEIDYLVFPELSIPRRVLTYIALKLKVRRISLIAGIEYEKRASHPHFPSEIKGLVSNQLVYILNATTNSKLEQVFIAQEKVIPAIHEESELFAVGGKWLQPNNNIKYLINHSGFHFSGLICNDLLNIDYRQSLRGKIDALIVVEWNKDVEMYDSLVQSSSNDLHCFVVQVNNRRFGDTRLRAPYKEAYERDRVRVRGGELDYYVIATLDIESLREFQRFHRSPSKPFKPVPTGFVMSDKRRKK